MTNSNQKNPEYGAIKRSSSLGNFIVSEKQKKIHNEYFKQQEHYKQTQSKSNDTPNRDH